MTTRTRSATLAKPTPKSPVRRKAVAKPMGAAPKPAAPKVKDVVIEVQYPQINKTFLQEAVEKEAEFLKSKNHFNVLSFHGTGTCSQREINGVNNLFDYSGFSDSRAQASFANSVLSIVNQGGFSNLFFNFAGTKTKANKIAELVEPMGFKKVFECMGNHDEPVHTFMTTIKASRG